MRITHDSRSTRSGIVLIKVLVMIVLLSLAAYQFAELMVQEYAAAQSALRAAQAKAAADSGIYYAAALLADPDAMSSTLGNNPFDNESAFHRIEVAATENRTVRFSIISPNVASDPSAAGFRYGVTDESGKINLNSLILKSGAPKDTIADILMMLPNMTEQAADSIIDWIDADEDPQPNGAEGASYPMYRCKNGPLDSIEELLLVQGVTPQLLFGTDRNRNGIQDPGEADSGTWDPGWAAYLTIYSRSKNVDADGAARIFVNDPSLATNYDALVEAVGQSMADFLILYRQYGAAPTTPPGQPPTPAASADQTAAEVKAIVDGGSMLSGNTIPYLYNLVDFVGVNIEVVVNGMRETYRVANPLYDAGQQRELLPKVLDKLTTQQTTDLAARINVMTAPAEVMACLTAVSADFTDADVQSIMSSRPAIGSFDPNDPVYRTTAWMLLNANIPASKLRNLERYITSRTQVYRVQSLGYSDQGGAAARVEAIIDTNDGRPRIIMWRDLTELGRGYNLSGQ